MSIGREITELEVTRKIIRNLEQLSPELQQKIQEKKLEIQQKFGYIPILSECLYLIKTKSNPELCRKNGCSNLGVFRGNISKDSAEYRYCSRVCSDSDNKRNEYIQQKRKGKIDYHATSIKSAKTRGEYIDPVTGLTGHQLAGKKATEKREQSGWREKTLQAQKNIPKELRQQRSKKRVKTIEEKYGVSHFGGGVSRLKDVEIFGYKFKVQGYEDIAIYQLIENGILPEDIEVINHNKDYLIEYVFEGNVYKYFPDLIIKSQNKFIEVKSEYWYDKELEKVNAKLQAAKDKNINIKMILYTKEDKNEVSRIRKNIKRVDKKEN